MTKPILVIFEAYDFYQQQTEFYPTVFFRDGVFRRNHWELSVWI